jgi:hypothetical protein
VQDAGRGKKENKKNNMKTKAVRIYGKKDLRLEEFELPEMKEDEILAHVISDSKLEKNGNINSNPDRSFRFNLQ